MNQNQAVGNFQQGGIISPFNNASASQVGSFTNPSGTSMFCSATPNMFNNTGAQVTLSSGNTIFGNSSAISLNNQNFISASTPSLTLNKSSASNVFGNQSVSFLNSQSTSINPTSGFNFNSPVSTQNNFHLNIANVSANTSTGLLSETSNCNSLSAFGSVSNNTSGFSLNSTSNSFFANQNILSNASSTSSNTNALQSKLNFGNITNSTANTFTLGGIQPTQANSSGIAFGSVQGPTSFSSSNPNFTSSASLLNNLQNITGSVSSIPSPFVTQGSNINLSSNNIQTSFALGSTLSTPISSLSTAKPAISSPFTLNTNLAISGTSQPSFTTTDTGLGGISNTKPIAHNASPLAISSVSAKKGLGGSPISDSSKSVLSKDATQKISIKQVKDTELPDELKESVEVFKKFVADQKKMREEIVKSNDSSSLMIRVEEESQMLRQSISEVANGLQKVQLQSNKLKNEITKEQSSIKIVQSVSESSINMSMDHNESSKYFVNKVRDMENRASLYLQEIEAVESMCNSTSKSALTSRDLVDIIRKMDDEFIGLAAKLYMVHERVKLAKTEYLRHLRQLNKHQNPFISIEGRFGDVQSSISGGSSTNNRYRIANASPYTLSGGDSVGSSPFDTSCSMKLASNKSFSASQPTSLIKPSLFGTNNNNQTGLVSTGTPNQSFSFTGGASSFGLNKPTNLFMTETEVSNKKRR